MTPDHHTPHRTPDGPLTVVVRLADGAEDALPVLEFHGPLDTHRLESALDHIDRAALRPTREPLWRHRLEQHGTGHHTLRLTTAKDGAPPVVFPAGLLADLLTHTPHPGPDGRRFPPTPLQRELIAVADADPAAGGHSEQLAFSWHGPLDLDRFTAAWLSVFDHESVLRTGFENGPQPHLVQRDRVTPEVVRLPHGSADWDAVVEADRRRGLDPRGSGPLRVTILGGDTTPTATGPAATGPPATETTAAETTAAGTAAGPAAPGASRILLTFHHALLDGWSVRILLHEFYRAYLADGVLPGGERRPDMSDYVQWLTGRDTAPAQEFWAGADLAPGTDLPVFAATGAGVGYASARLTARQTERLSRWAAGLGSPESSVLHAVWALLLYRAGGSEGPARIRFHATVSGRGIPFAGVERLPAPLRNALPVTVDVDPRAPLPALLDALRDQAVDRSSYEWVTAGQICTWSGLRGTAAAGSLLVFEDRMSETGVLVRLLAQQGVRVGPAETLGARTAFPFTLVAHHGDDGSLALTASYDRSRLGEAGQLLAHTAHLLRRIPAEADRSTTVGELVDLLADLPRPPRPAPGRAVVRPYAEDPAVPPLAVLRPATRPGAGTVCLLQTPAAPRALHTSLVRAYRGAETIALLRPADPVRLRDAVLGVLTDGPVVLGGYSGTGVTGYEVARAVAASGARAPQVVLTAAGTPAADFARTLQDALRRAG